MTPLERAAAILDEHLPRFSPNGIWLCARCRDTLWAPWHLADVLDAAGLLVRESPTRDERQALLQRHADLTARADLHPSRRDTAPDQCWQAAP